MLKISSVPSVGSTIAKLVLTATLGTIAVTQARAQVPLQNGSFELPRLANGQTVEPMPLGYGWIPSGAVGLARDVAATTVKRVEPPMGRQWVYLRPGTAISQTVSLQAGATYNVSMSAMQWLSASGTSNLKVSIGGASAQQTPQDLSSAAIGTPAPKMTFAGFTVPSTGAYTLRIEAPPGNPPYNVGSYGIQNIGVWLDDVVISQTGTNSAPSVEISYPSPGQAISGSVPVRATVIDPDGSTITKVEFYDLNVSAVTPLATVTQAPWTITVGNSAQPRHMVAKAYDGISFGTSPPVIFSVNNGNAVPYVIDGTFEKPFYGLGQAFWGNSSGFSWTATQFAGLLSAGGPFAYGGYLLRPPEGLQSAVINSGYSGDYIKNYLTLPAGNYGLTFVGGGGTVNAYNSFGAIGSFTSFSNGRAALPFTIPSSSAIQLTLEAANQSFVPIIIDDVRIGPAGPPTVAITAPAANQVFDAPTAITLVADIDSFDRTVTEVEFFSTSSLGTISIGKATGGTSTVRWYNPAPVPSGHTITAAVKDSLTGATVTATSAPVNITVNSGSTYPGFFNAGFEYLAHTELFTVLQSFHGWQTTGSVYLNTISANPNYLVGGAAPEGIAAATISGTGSLSQNVYLNAGSYAITFRAGHPSTSGSLRLMVNGTQVGSSISTTTSYALYTTATFAISSAGVQTIKLESTSSGSNVTLDDLKIVPQLTSQSITFGAQSSQSFVSSGTFQLNPVATASSGLPISYSSTTSSVCTISGTTVTMLTTGNCTIAANQAGNSSYSAATQVTQNITIAAASQTITFGAQAGQNFVGGGTFALNPVATASSGLTVSYSSTTTAVCTISGTTVTMVAAGTCTIAANQAGNASYSAAPQVTQNITVGKANQTITFGSAPTVNVGGTGTVSATGGASGNAVTFTSTTTAVCTTSGTNGSTVTGVATGTCTIAANQAGNANYNAATQATQNITIGQTSQTITFGAAPTVNVGSTGTVSATGGASGNPVTFTSTTTAVCTTSGTNGATVTGVTAGTCTIAANQAGNTSYSAAPQVTQNSTVGKGGQTIAVLVEAGPFVFAPTGTITIVTATASSGLAVTYSSNSQTVCTVSGNAVTTVSAGLCSIAMDQAGNSNYHPAPQVVHSATIQKRAQAITFGAQSAQLLANGGTFALNPVATASSGLAVSYSSTTTSVCTISGTTVTKVAAGTCTIAANQAGNGSYNAATQITQNIVLTSPTVPGAPTGANATAGNASASVTFIAPASNGGSAITGYTATSNPGGLTGTCNVPCSSISVTGLTNGTAYTFSVTATNAIGPGAASELSNSVTPVGMLVPPTISLAFVEPAIALKNGVPQHYAKLKFVLSNPNDVSLSNVTVSSALPATPSQMKVANTGSSGMPAVHVNVIPPGCATATRENDSPLVMNLSSQPPIPPATDIKLVAASMAPNTTCSVEVGVTAVQGTYVATTGNIQATGPGLVTLTGNAATTSTLSVHVPPDVVQYFDSYIATLGADNYLTFKLRNFDQLSALTNVSVINNFPSMSTMPDMLAQMTLKDASVSTKLNGVANACATVTKTDGTNPIAAGDTGIMIKVPTLAISGECEIRVNITVPSAGTYTNITSAPQATGPILMTGLVNQSTVVFKPGQTITFNQPAAQTYSNGGTFAVSATSTSGRPVTISSSTSTVCSVNSGSTLVTILSAGVCTLNATQNGAPDDVYASAQPVARSVTITKADQSINGFAAISNKTTTTPPFAVTASASSGLAVTFSTTTSVTCSVTATGTVTILAAGTCTITANQVGNINYNAATSVGQSFAITAGVTLPNFIGSIGASGISTVGTTGNVQVTVSPGSGLSGVTFSSTPSQTFFATGPTNNVWTANWTPNRSGVFLVKATATTTDGQTVTTTSEVFVTEVPAPTAFVSPTVTSTAGAIAGNLSIGDLGSAQYSIPIAIPPGIAGVQPSIALAYSSQGGNGHVGMGWAVSGLSSVTRCPRTIAQDGARSGINYDLDITNDAFCIDGQRLIQTHTRPGTYVDVGSNTTLNINIVSYRTEIDRYDHIEAYVQPSDSAVIGPLKFTVKTKSGLIMEYGLRWWLRSNGNAQKTVSGNTRGNSVAVWPLDKVSDRNGNYYIVDYAGSQAIASVAVNNPSGDSITPVGAYPAGEMYPVQITYTHNETNDVTHAATSAVNRVVFEYEDRPALDRHALFDSGGGQRILTKWLKQIVTYRDGIPLGYPYYSATSQNPNLYPVCSGAQCGAVVHKYKLDYDPTPATNRSRLISIEQCVPGSPNDICLPKTNFEWTGFTESLNGAGSGVVGCIYNGGACQLDSFQEYRAADLNGDGRTDLVRRYGNSTNTGTIRALIALPSGGFEQRELIGNAEVAGGTDTTWSVLDMNGDGKADFFSVNNSSHYMRVCITNAIATGYTCSSPQDNGIAGPTDGKFLQGDFNGDGKIDVLLYREQTTVNGVDAFKWDLLLGSDTGFSTTPRTVYTPFTSNYFTYNGGGAGKFSLDSAVVGDFNGDGRADILMAKKPNPCKPETGPGTGEACRTPDSTIYSWQVFFSDPVPEAGNANLFVWTTKEVLTDGFQPTAEPIQGSVDFNGDGVADVFTPNRLLCLSGGDGSFGSFETVPASTTGPAYTAGSLCESARTDSAGVAGLPDDFVWADPADHGQGLLPFNQIIYGDFDGDGRSDMAVKKKNLANTAVVCLSRSAQRTQPNGTLAPLGRGVYFECKNWALATNDSFANIKAGDFNGDGKTDLISSNSLNSTNMLLSLAEGPMVAGTESKTGVAKVKLPPDLLTRITNGLGASTLIDYAPLTDPSAYTKGSASTGNKIDVQSPMIVVKTTKSSDGLGGVGTFNTSYSYTNLVGQTDGRGLLGFGSKTVSHNNGQAIVSTVTNFEQEWWKAGRIASVYKYVDGRLVNWAKNTYQQKAPIPGEDSSKSYYQVHLTGTVERSWNLVGITRQPLPYTKTTTPLDEIDARGNVKKVISETYEPGPTDEDDGTPDNFSKTTDSEFNADDDSRTGWIIGRVTKATVTHKKDAIPCNQTGNSCIKRESSFTYHSNGQLATEVIEPVLPVPPAAADASLKLTKTYDYDVYGNPRLTLIKFDDASTPGSTAKTRKTETFYTANGRFVQSVDQYIDFGTSTKLTENRVYDPSFGTPTSIRDPNNIDTRNTYDGFGRKTSESIYDSQSRLLGWNITTYIAGTSGYSVENRSHVGGYSISSFDSLSREISSSVKTFNGTEATASLATTTTTYDTYGRKTQVSTPRGGTVAGTTVTDTTLYTTLTYDKLGRVETQSLRPGSATADPLTSTTTSWGTETVSSRTFSTMTVTQTGAELGSHSVTKKTDSQGRTAKVVDNALGVASYSYDATGNLTNVSGPGNINETMTYDVRGRKITATNANVVGQYEYKYNGAGELIWQKDPNGNQTTMLYDDLGRLKSRSEPGFMTTWDFDCANAKGKTCKVTSKNGGLYAGSDGATHSTAYDAQSRPYLVQSMIDGRTYNRFTLYNAQGQVSLISFPPAAYANRTDPGISVSYAYNGNGFMTGATNVETNTPIMTVLGRYADGSLAAGQHHLPAGTGYMNSPFERDYDGLGRLSRHDWSDGTNSIQKGEYKYDGVGNVKWRNFATQGWSERYCYDALHRLRGSYLGVAETTACSGQTAQFSYSPDGNMETKNGATGAVGTIGYGNATRSVSTPTAAGPHAVATAQGRTYSYDNNGNFTGDGVRSVSYTAFNLPTIMSGSNPNIALGTSSLEYDYDGGHARVKEISTTGGAVTKTIYVGSNSYERITNSDGSIEHKYYLPGADGIAAVVTKKDGQADKTVFWYKDHLGSPIAEFSSATAVTNLGFDSWGLRRKSTGSNSFTASLTASDLNSFQSSRGYTGHQHLDEIGLVHMNGRIYDPLIGRFLQADPIIEDPYNSQSFNRYTYVFNNPLAHTDPSGFSTWTQIRRPIAAIIVAAITYNFAYGLQTANLYEVVTESALAGIKATSAVAAGFASGGVAGGNIQSAIAGAFSAGLFVGAGDLGFAAGSLENVSAHAVAGCISAGVNGGSCRQGAVSAGFAELVGPNFLTKNQIGNTAIHATIGGVGSLISKGRFGNGALTGAFGYLFNCGVHDCSKPGAAYKEELLPLATGGLEPVCTTECIAGAAGIVRGGVLAIWRLFLRAEEPIIVYRGVSEKHPGYANATRGTAEPQGGTATAVEHALGNTKSEFTSWTTDGATAYRFATENGKSSGVVLVDKVAPSKLIQQPANVHQVMQESEVLRRGVVNGAKPTFVKP